MPSKEAYEALVSNEVDYISLEEIRGAHLGYACTDLPARDRRRWCPASAGTTRAQPMLDYFLAFREFFNRFPGFNYEVQGVFQERVDGRIKFHTYVVRQ